MEVAGIFVSRLGSRIIARSSVSFNSFAGGAFRSKSDYVPPTVEYADSRVSLHDAAGAQPIWVEGYQGDVHMFSTQRARDIVNRAQEEIENGEGTSVDVQGIQADVNGEEELADAFNCNSSVSLHMVMQSSVPEPYQNGGRPTHRNMPNGCDMQRQKYLSGLMQGAHPSRNFSSSAAMFSPASSDSLLDDLDSDQCPQGIQGDDCANFKLWLENCQKYNFGNCQEQLQDIKSGRRTIQDVFAEQDRLIKKIVADYKDASKKIKDSVSSVQGLQGEIPLHSLSFAALNEAEQASPQGVQGHRCKNFNLWLKNCEQYGFGDCEDQLQGVQTGQKTLSDIFVEQQRLIRQIAADYSSGKVIHGVRSYSTDAKSKNPPETSGQSAVQLSQRDKLKRAIKEYGATVVVFHVGMSLSMLGCFYVAVSSGLDVVGILRSIGVGEGILESKLAAGASTFVVAYASYKVFAPLRIAITLSVTPFIVRYLRRIGFLKPPKPSA